jgi:hypothetical protein
MKKTLVLALVALVSATAAAAADPAPQVSTEEKKICKTEKVLGSRTRTQRICLTEMQWRELAARTQKGIDEMGSRMANGQASSN